MVGGPMPMVCTKSMGSFRIKVGGRGDYFQSRLIALVGRWRFGGPSISDSIIFNFKLLPTLQLLQYN